MVPPPPSLDDIAWVVVHTKPRCEKKFAALLLRDSIEHELPLVPSRRRYRTGAKTFTKPLFPGYVFSRLATKHKTRLWAYDLVVRTITAPDQDKFVLQLENIRRMVASGLELQLAPMIKKGTRVRVCSGPLWGVEGMVDNPDHPKGVVVSMDVLQQGVLVRISREHLEIMPD